MAETIEKAKEQLFKFWNDLDKNKKMKLGISSLLIIISITGLIYFTTKVNYEIAYESLSPKDSGLITKRLDEMGIEWKTENNGTEILVPEDKKNKVIIQLASEGLPKEGFSILDALDRSDWTMTEYEKIQLIRYADQSSLEANISKIDGIEEATVTIDIVEDTAFFSDEDNATASVFVVLSGRTPLSSNKITAIRNLVSGSFKDLNPENVTITDDFGNSYDNINDSLENYSMNEQLNLRYTVESKLNNSLKKLLENFFGYGNVAVITSAKIDFDSEITNIREFSPPIEGSDEGLVISMEKVEEHSINGITGGVAGVDSNTSDITDYSELDDIGAKYDKVSEVINYELDVINKQIKKMPGEVKSVTVAVVINEDAITDGELTDEKKKDIEELIYAATGLETEKVKVSAGSFNIEFNNQESDEFRNNNSVSSNIPVWVFALGAFALIGMAGIFMVARNNNKNDINGILESKSKEIEEIEAIDFDKEKSEYKAQINDFVEKKPESVAQLLRTWINEE